MYQNKTKTNFFSSCFSDDFTWLFLFIFFLISKKLTSFLVLVQFERGRKINTVLNITHSLFLSNKYQTRNLFSFLFFTFNICLLSLWSILFSFLFQLNIYMKTLQRKMVRPNKDWCQTQVSVTCCNLLSFLITW